MKSKVFFLLVFLIVSLVSALYQTPKVKAQESKQGSFGNPQVTLYNWTKFWKLFNAHSDWDLEYNNGSGWISDKSALQIIKNYTAWIDDEWVPANKSDSARCKITLNFTAPYQADYRLTFGIDLDVKNYTHKEGAWNYTITYQNYTVYFDWTDIKELPLDSVNHGIKPVGDESWFWFRIRKNNVPQGYNLVIDPSFGNTNTGSGVYVCTSLRFFVCRFQMPASGSITKLTAYLDSDSADCVGKGVIYSDDSGDPKDLLATSSETSIGVITPDYDWVEFTISYEGIADAWYHLGYGASHTTWWKRDDGDADQTAKKENGYSYDGFPNPFGTIAEQSAYEICIYANYTVEEGEEYIADLSQSASTSWSVLTEWDAIADFSQSLATSWNVLTEWDAILDLTQSLTTSWNILANLNTFVNLAQAVSTTWNVLIGWNAIVDFTQTLSTSWTVLIQSNFNIIASLSNTFSWLVDIIHTVGGVAYIADLSQAISTTWNVLTQWNSIVDLTQALSTTWTVLIQSAFNIVPSLSNTFTWTVDILKGVVVDHIVDLTLTVATSWLVDVIRTPWTTIYATKGFVLATIMLSLFIGLPLLCIIMLIRRRKD